MSTNRDVVLDALDGMPKTRRQLAEDTGLELAAISVILTALKGDQEAERTAEGWIRTNGAAPKPRVHEATAANDPTIPPPAAPKAARKPRRTAKMETRAAATPPRAKPRPKTAKVKPRANGKRAPRGPAVALPVPGEFTYSLTESLAVRIDRVDGTCAPGYLPRTEALRLAIALARWRPLLEQA